MNELLETPNQAERSRSSGLEAAEYLAIPMDVSLWVSKRQLRRWVEDSVESLNWASPKLAELIRRHPESEVKALFCTLTLAYLTGNFSGEEIVEAAARDAEFRAIRPAAPPRPEELTAFRRLHRGLLKQALADVLCKVVKARFAEDSDRPLLSSQLRRAIFENAVERLNIARHMDRGAEA